MSAMKQNPAEKLSGQERENIVWRPIVRACDDSHKNFEKIRTIQPKPEPKEQNG